MNHHAAFAHFPKITYLRYKRLRNYFSNLGDLWTADINDFTKAGLEEDIAREFIRWRKENPVAKITERLEREGITTVSLGEANYPRLLAEIPDPPHTLFVRGKLPLQAQPTVAVVGTRKCTSYGKQITEELTAELVQQGIAIVSGLALGIDGIAHQAALKTGGVTLAVLGSGINRGNVYPASHQRLAEEIIASGGSLVSEYPPGFEPTQYSFPARNRIIAGLSLGVLVTEAPVDSGALLTAKCALDYNREVFAIPHPITSDSGAGGNKFIKLGAKCVTGVEDILNELNITQIAQAMNINQLLPENPTEASLLTHLSKEPTPIDLLIKHSGLTSATVNATLTLMEMKGKIKNVGGMNYILR